MFGILLLTLMPSIQATCGLDKGDCVNGQTCDQPDDCKDSDATCKPFELVANVCECAQCIGRQDCKDGQDCTNSSCGIFGKCVPIFHSRCVVELSNGCLVGGFQGNCKIGDRCANFQDCESGLCCNN
ncbi:41483_t:CDS:2, partial [Gigaspora margarita]